MNNSTIFFFSKFHAELYIQVLSIAYHDINIHIFFYPRFNHYIRITIRNTYTFTNKDIDTFCTMKLTTKQ